MVDPSTDTTAAGDIDPAAIYIDGLPYTVNDLTYGEQRILRDLVIKNSPDNVSDPDEAAEADFVPAVITVIKLRDDPSFTYEQALAFKPADLEPPARPTGQAAKKRPARSR